VFQKTFYNIIIWLINHILRGFPRAKCVAEKIRRAVRGARIPTRDLPFPTGHFRREIPTSDFPAIPTSELRISDIGIGNSDVISDIRPTCDLTSYLAGCHGYYSTATNNSTNNWV